ncbi:hypothetical protein [Nocardia aurantiaca]|uniref:Uncharacterized protein n=1 Tax=Nocardia aurantiaca TaxID=2675850 RepID=A0A6I3KLT6_9NOCA|nr:hypothetical protein [Nocardia aurantiaca]MTE11553.1 hypothetical protein [Nocardia aurantiaca]
MIGEIALHLIGAGIGTLLGWMVASTRPYRSPRPGTTVEEIRARLDRESQGRHGLLT